MTANVEKIAEQVKALPKKELDEFLSWLADYELQHMDKWDKEIARDSQPGGRLSRVLDGVRQRLLRQQEAVRAGERGEPFEDVVQRLESE